MRARIRLRSPFGGALTRDILDGRWAEAEGVSDTEIGGEYWALPGLTDAHAHLAADQLAQPGDMDGAMKRAREALQAGLMLLLDKGWGDTTTIDMLDRLPQGERPDIEAAARVISVEGGYYPGFGRVTDGRALENVVAAEARAGRGWVKLIGDWPRRGVGPVANFDARQLEETVRVAESNGARVAIHTMARDVPSVAVAAGVHSIEHGLFLTERDLGLLGERNGMWVPTILRMEATRRQLGDGSSGGRLLSEGLANVRSLLRLAVEAGVMVLAGTDLVGSPANVAAEAIKLADYGLTNRQALMAVAGSAFSATGRPMGFESGSPANAVFFRDDPMNDLGVLANPEMTIRLGMVL